jgi:membrane protein involved in colicin uptake
MVDKTTQVIARIEAQKAQMAALQQHRQDMELYRQMKNEERDLLLQAQENQRRKETARRDEQERQKKAAVEAVFDEQKALSAKIKEKMAALKAKKLKEKETKKMVITSASASLEEKRVTMNKSVMAQKEAGAAAEMKAAEMKRRAKQMADLSDMASERMRFTNQMDRPTEDHDVSMGQTESESESDSESSSDSSSSGSSSSSSSASAAATSLGNLTLDDSYHSEQYPYATMKTNRKKRQTAISNRCYNANGKINGGNKNAVKPKEPEMDLSDLLIKFEEEDSTTVFSDPYADFNDSSSF